MANLAPGEYSVTVTDNRGCTDETIVNVDVDIVNTIEDLQLAEINLVPNPTKNLAQLNVEFVELVDEVHVQVINMMGQVLQTSVDRNIVFLNKEIDLSQYPEGLYLVRIVADNQGKTLKLVRAGH